MLQKLQFLSVIPVQTVKIVLQPTLLVIQTLAKTLRKAKQARVKSWMTGWHPKDTRQIYYVRHLPKSESPATMTEAPIIGCSLLAVDTHHVKITNRKFVQFVNVYIISAILTKSKTFFLFSTKNNFSFWSTFEM